MNKPNISITRKLWFCAGHRVMNHESKCNNLHGHNYIVYIKAKAKENQLDLLGRVIDFSVLKDLVNNWIQEKLDHTFMIYEKDLEVIEIFKSFKQPKEVYIMKENPTAENIAKHLLVDIIPNLLKDTNIEVESVLLYETENNYSEVCHG